MSKRISTSTAITHHIRGACLCLHVQRAARAVARRYDGVLRPMQLTNGQFSLLMSLNRAEAPSIGSVATLLAMDRTTLTANLKPLERRGLVKVAVDAADRRSRRMTLTPAGRTLLAAAIPLWQRAQALTEDLVSPSHCDRLRADLRALSREISTALGVQPVTLTPTQQRRRPALQRPAR
jgi:DNA-binding MarR family transcriptional regulator